MKSISIVASGVALFDAEMRDEARSQLRQRIAHLSAAEQTRYLEAFEQAFAETSSKTVEQASADSIVAVLRVTANDLERTIDGTLIIAKNIDHGRPPKGPVTFLLGEAAGYVVIACQALKSAAETIEKSMETLAEMRAHEAEGKPPKVEH